VTVSSFFLHQFDTKYFVVQCYKSFTAHYTHRHLVILKISWDGKGHSAYAGSSCLDILLYRLFGDSLKPVDASERKGVLIQHNLVSNITALLQRILHLCTNIFFSNMFQHCCLLYIQYFSVNVWHPHNRYRLKS
jgi:hypothetical protein